MSSEAVERMRARARQVHARAAVRRWQYRQRNLAAGVWFRVRRVLADAKAAYAVSDDEARRLIGDGHTPEACGAEMVPEKTIVFVDEARLAALESPRQIPVGLGPEFLAAAAVALIPFAETAISGKGRRGSPTSSA